MVAERHTESEYLTHTPSMSPTSGRSAVPVFGGSFARMVARSLIFLMCVQPISIAFGADLGGSGDVSGVVQQTSSDVVATEQSLVEVRESEEELPAVSNDDQTPLDETSTGSATEDPAVETISDTEGETNESVPEEVAGEDPRETEGSVNASDDGDEQHVEGAPSNEDEETVADDATGSEDLSDDRGDAEGSVGTATDTYATSTSTSTSTITTSEDQEEETEEAIVVPVVNDPSNKYTFGEGDCTLVAEGEFYCVAPTTARHANADPRVYAEKDREGDREIYYFDGAEVVRITNNGYDDFAPVFDNDSRRIVWQANVFDRTQIMVHDLTEKTTRQITTGKQNSSNPDIHGDLVVWQEWVDTNWEVMMADVDTAGEYTIERLTDNAVHDMFPQLFDGMVTWQHEQGNSWEVIVHDLKTGKEHALQKDEDTKYENPRFVLLFDSKHENGDVETIGYDLDTGEMMELGTKANPEPIVPASPKEEIPDVPLTASSSTLLKVGKEGEGGDQ